MLQFCLATIRASAPSNPAANNLGDNDSDDWLQQQLRDLGPRGANLRAFLADYAQCKNSRSEELLRSMVAYSYFEPPSNFQYWAPRTMSPSSQDLERHNVSSPTFSQALDQFRIFLQKGDPGCARFWSDMYRLHCLAVQKLTFHF